MYVQNKLNKKTVFDVDTDIGHAGWQHSILEKQS
jgi:hypothetical protein